MYSTLTTYKKYSSSIENYILDRCVDQMKFTLKVVFIYNLIYIYSLL